MFIQTEKTPNPETLKFLPGRVVLASGVRDFRTADEAAVSPLARALFDLDGVDGVFLAEDFVSVTKSGEADWARLKPMALAAIMDHYMTGLPVIDEAAGAGDDHEDDAVYEGETLEIVNQIKDLIDTRVRPAVAGDGGDIVFRHFDEDSGVVKLVLRGACLGCPSSTLTLKQGIENMLKVYIPEVTSVEAVM